MAGGVYLFLAPFTDAADRRNSIVIHAYVRAILRQPCRPHCAVTDYGSTLASSHVESRVAVPGNLLLIHQNIDYHIERN
jgi:hypothetical protein